MQYGYSEEQNIIQGIRKVQKCLASTYVQWFIILGLNTFIFFKAILNEYDCSLMK